MKTSLKLLLSLAALALVAGVMPVRGEDESNAKAVTNDPASEQKHGRPAERAGQRKDPLAQSLKAMGLTKEQKAKAAEIRKKENEQLQALRGDASLSQKQKKEKAAGIRSEAHQHVRALLTPEQQEKFDQALQKGGEPHKKGAKKTKA